MDSFSRFVFIGNIPTSTFLRENHGGQIAFPMIFAGNLDNTPTFVVYLKNKMEP
jgi:hypothetical protein